MFFSTQPIHLKFLSEITISLVISLRDHKELGDSWTSPGASWGSLGVPWVSPGCILEPLGGLLGSLERFLGTSRGLLSSGVRWVTPGCLLESQGRLLGSPGGLQASWTILGVSWDPLGIDLG